METVPLDDDTLSTADCVVVVTNHDSYDWEWIASKSQLIVDTRNATGKSKAGHIFRL